MNEVDITSKQSNSRPTWELVEKVGYSAECPHCGYDLLSKDDYVMWVQPEGVQAALEDEDYCARCYQPITDRGYEARLSAAEEPE